MFKSLSKCILLSIERHDRDTEKGRFFFLSKNKLGIVGKTQDVQQ